MCSYVGAYACGIFFGVTDLLIGLAVLAFYSYELFIHRHCDYLSGVAYCHYFLYKSNHDLRTKLGIGEGVICIIIAILLIYMIYKKWGTLVWGWLVKPVVIAIFNLYFVTDWVIKRGKNYHTYDTEEEVEQELLYIYFGAATAVVQLVLSIWFCLTAGGFSYHVRRRNRQLYQSCETKV